eukprot:jgi/Chlat1/1583/Chrsp123S01845
MENEVDVAVASKPMTLAQAQAQLTKLQQLQSRVSAGTLRLPDGGAKLDASKEKLEVLVKDFKQEQSGHKVAAVKKRKQADGVRPQQQAPKMNKAELQDFVKLQEVALRGAYPSVKEVVFDMQDVTSEEVFTDHTYQDEPFRLNNYHIYKRTGQGRGEYTALECLPAHRELANTGVCAVGRGPSTADIGPWVELGDITSWDACIALSTDNCTAVVRTKRGQYFLGRPAAEYQKFHQRLAAVLHVIPLGMEAVCNAETNDKLVVRNLSAERLAKLLADRQASACLRGEQSLAWENASEAEKFMRAHARLLAAAAVKLKESYKPRQPLHEALSRVFRKLELEMPQERTVRRSGKKGEAASGSQPPAMPSTPKGKEKLVFTPAYEAEPSTPANQDKRPAAAARTPSPPAAPANSFKKLQRLQRHAACEDLDRTGPQHDPEGAGKRDIAEVDSGADTGELPVAKRRCIIEDEERGSPQQPQQEAGAAPAQDDQAAHAEQQEADGFLSLEVIDADDVNRVLVDGECHPLGLHNVDEGTPLGSERLNGCEASMAAPNSAHNAHLGNDHTHSIKDNLQPGSADAIAQTIAGVPSTCLHDAYLGNDHSQSHANVLQPGLDAAQIVADAPNSCPQDANVCSVHEQSHDNVAQPEPGDHDADMLGQSGSIGLEAPNNMSPERTPAGPSMQADCSAAATDTPAGCLKEIDYRQKSAEGRHDDVVQPDHADHDADVLGQGGSFGLENTNNTIPEHAPAGPSMQVDCNAGATDTPVGCLEHLDYGHKSAEMVHMVTELLTQMLTPEQHRAIVSKLLETGNIHQQQETRNTEIKREPVADARAEGAEQNVPEATQRLDTVCRLEAAADDQRSGAACDDVAASQERGFPSDLQHTSKRVTCYVDRWPHCIKVKLSGLRTLDEFKEQALKKFAAAKYPFADNLMSATISYEDQVGASCALADDEDFEELTQSAPSLPKLLWSFS